MRRAAREGPVVGSTWPGIGLRVSGPSAVIRQFEADYGTAAGGQAAAVTLALDVRVNAPAVGEVTDVVRRRGRRRTTTWDVRFGPAAADPLQIEIDVRGVFGIPLVQSLIVEPALSLAMPRHGFVLLPAAGILADDGPLILLGAPRAGKSTLAVRALVRGRQLLGDDHVLVDASGAYRPFPRRLRLYPDVQETSRTAYRRLTPRRCRSLLVRRTARLLSRGAVSLPVLVPPGELSDTPPVRGATDGGAARIAVLQRSREAREATVTSLAPPDLVGHALAILAADRAHLPTDEPSWHAEAARTADAEQQLLAAAWSEATGRLITVPADWPAPRGLAFYERALRLDA